MIYYILIVNAFAFMLMGIDKRRAIRHDWRIPEKTFFLLALLGGAIGAWCGMYFFHHKTKHWYFVIGMPLIAFVEYISLGILFLRS